MTHRVAVTGMGVIAPIGADVPELVASLRAGRSGVGPITHFDPATLPTRIAGEVKHTLESPIPDRKVAFALAAAREAWTQATSGVGRPRGAGGVSLGVGLELFSMDDLAELRRAPRTREHLTERLSFLQTPSDLCVHLIAQRYELTAPPVVHISACAAGTDAIGHAFRLIRAGRRSFMLAGGTDSMINPLGVAGFATLSATSTRNQEPARASRPFERTRDGFVIGEGAAILVLERLSDARARGAPILGELAGYGCSLDAHAISEPHPSGRGAALAMRRALDDARLEPHAISAINAHGTGTPKNDVRETLAIKSVFGEHAARTPVSSTKSMIGHLISAAGAVEAVAALATMNADFVHPTINLDEPDPECDLDYVAHDARPLEQRYVLSASYAFGGHNAAIILAGARETNARG